MKSFMFSFCFIMLCNVLTASELFRTITVTEAKSISNSLDKNIFVYYYEDNCAFCELAEDSLFANPDIKSYLSEHFVNIKANFKNSVYASWYKEYEVTCLPTMQIISPEGEVIAEVKGITSAANFMEILSNYKDLIVELTPELVVSKVDSTLEAVEIKEETNTFHTIQLGAFRHKENVFRFKGMLENQLNYSLTIFENTSDGLFRLFSGQYSDREEAKNNLDLIVEYGLEFWIRDVQPAKSFYELSIEQ